MRLLDKKEVNEAQKFIDYAISIARYSQCRKSRRGVVIVNNNVIIGSGYNSPPNDKPCCKCLREDIHNNLFTELCYGVHAEQQAIIRTLKNGCDLAGSRLFHVKIKNGSAVISRGPSCTQCSKNILESGITEIVLMENDGLKLYTAEEFNNLSFENIIQSSKI